jgi:hypothetical protein
MREALKEVGVEVLGVKDGGAYIGLVTDAATGATDGTITPNDDIIIEGDRLKIAPDGDENLGALFMNEAGESLPVTHRFTVNDPKRIIALVPGTYRLYVVTRFSNSSTLLKEKRSMEYDRWLTVR